MVRKYEQKNPYFKNTRLSIEQSKWLVLMYLKGAKASQCGELLGYSHVSIGKLYKLLDEVITYRSLFWKFTEFLDKQNEDVLKDILYVVRGILDNMNRTPAPPTEEWDIECLMAHPNFSYYLGDGDYYPRTGQFEACIKTCESDTPPLTVKQMIDKGKVAEVRRKRICCDTCPLKLKQVYRPRSDSRVFYAREREGKNIVYEPNLAYNNDATDIITFWVDILWFLGSLRKVKNFNLITKVMHGAYFAALKSAEYKLNEKSLHPGFNIPTPLLYPHQREDEQRGFYFVSMLDVPMMNFVLEELKNK